MLIATGHYGSPCSWIPAVLQAPANLSAHSQNIQHQSTALSDMVVPANRGSNQDLSQTGKPQDPTWMDGGQPADAHLPNHPRHLARIRKENGHNNDHGGATASSAHHIDGFLPNTLAGDRLVLIGICPFKRGLSR
ncbi:hypothetical protein NLG97_g6217 [Lecanicillium saksenae]|uniref:Uncharacterized protein n=1 Tax=Lecanicillium saksenae TaxID=468837 RepID=A0ACC1QRX5_9HYPO|nr:hypothetical protein NLG97_g6217 [Lecanicillium saksenae]